MEGQSAPLGNNAGVTRMVEFGDRIWEYCIYYKFGHLDNMSMGSMAKELVDEFSIEYAANTHDVS